MTETAATITGNQDLPCRGTDEAATELMKVASYPVKNRKNAILSLVLFDLNSKEIPSVKMVAIEATPKALMTKSPMDSLLIAKSNGDTIILEVLSASEVSSPPGSPLELE